MRRNLTIVGGMLCALLANVLISLYYGMYFPVVPSDEPNVAVDLIGRESTLEALEKSAEIMREKAKLDAIKMREEGLGIQIIRFKKNAIFINWFPWVLVFLWLRLKGRKEVLIALSIPFLGFLIKALWFWELPPLCLILAVCSRLVSKK